MTPILIAGPTASGKSALALALARALGGQVINADSQQIYSGWRVLTARPSTAEEAVAPHRLYGHVDLDQPYSAGHWLADITPLLHRPHPVIVGGTGLYFKALTEGLAPIPPVPPEIRAEGEAELERLGRSAFAAALARRDPRTAAGLDLENPRRALRAWEVLEATGTGLAEWQARTPPPVLPLDRCFAVALSPDRAAVYAHCDRRFDQMIAQGAIDEARAVMAMNLPSEAPGLKAVGAGPLFAWLKGKITRDHAIARAKTDTRRYAKRQMTWIRNQMAAWHHLPAADPDTVITMLQS